MPKYGYYKIEAPDVVHDHLKLLPVAARRPSFERFINRALDEAGWPRGERGEMPMPANYYYVTVWKYGRVSGHVGPIPDQAKALAAARSWHTAGHTTEVGRYPVGPCLTNAFT